MNEQEAKILVYANTTKGLTKAEIIQHLEAIIKHVENHDGDKFNLIARVYARTSIYKA